MKIGYWFDLLKGYEGNGPIDWGLVRWYTN